MIQQRPFAAGHRLGKNNSFRADEGLPIVIGSIAATGEGVVIKATPNGSVQIGQEFVAGDFAVLLGGPTRRLLVGDGVTVGAGAVVEQSTIGNGAAIGARAYVVNSTVPAGAVVPPGTILIDDVVVGAVEW